MRAVLGFELGDREWVGVGVGDGDVEWMLGWILGDEADVGRGSKRGEGLVRRWVISSWRSVLSCVSGYAVPPTRPY